MLNQELMTVKQIEEASGYKDTYVRSVRNFIKAHPDRYGYYAAPGNRLTNVMAFFDALEFRDAINKGVDVPAFDIDEVRRMIGGGHDDI